VARKKVNTENSWKTGSKHMRTSIGRSKNTRPKNKHKRRNWKKYRGQGK